MSKKYHIKPDGTPDICRAEKGKCRYGSNIEHFNSSEEAQKYSDDCNEMWRTFEEQDDSLIVTYDGLKNGLYGFPEVNEEELSARSIKPGKAYILATEKNLKNIEKRFIENLEKDSPELYKKLKGRFGGQFTESTAFSDSVKSLLKYPEEVSFRKHRFYEFPENLELASTNVFENLESKVVNSVCLQLHRGDSYNERDILIAFNKSSMEDLYKAGDQSIENERYKCTIKWNGPDWRNGKFRGVGIEFTDKSTGTVEQTTLNKNSIFSKYNKYTNPDRYKDYEFEYQYRDVDGEKFIRGSKEEVSQKIKETMSEYHKMEFENSIQFYDNVIEIEEKGRESGQIRNSSGGTTKIIKRKS